MDFFFGNLDRCLFNVFPEAFHAHYSGTEVFLSGFFSVAFVGASF